MNFFAARRARNRGASNGVQVDMRSPDWKRLGAALAAASVALAVTACAAGEGSSVTPAQTSSSPASASADAARPASEKVPAAAKAVTITLDLGLNQGGRKPPKPVTITDPAKVRALTALINGLALFPPGSFHCPADFGGNLVLTFRAGPRTPALAVAAADLAGCDGVDFAIGGKTQPALAGPGTDTGPQILKLAGLPWKLPVA